MQPFKCLSGGEIDITTANNGIKANSIVDISAGVVNIKTEDKDLVCAERKISSKADVQVNGVKIASNY